MSSLFDSAWTALSPYLHNDNAYHRLEPSEPPGCRAIRSVLARNRLNDPSLWRGYNDFIRTAPPELGQITSAKYADYFPREVMRNCDLRRATRNYPGLRDFDRPETPWQSVQYIALHYPVDGGNDQVSRAPIERAISLLRGY